MHNLPILPPMAYRLWLPQLSLYVRETVQVNHQFIGTANRERAAVLPEPEARALAHELIRARGLVVELKAPLEGVR